MCINSYTQEETDNKQFAQADLAGGIGAGTESLPGFLTISKLFLQWSTCLSYVPNIDHNLNYKYEAEL